MILNMGLAGYVQGEPVHANQGCKKDKGWTSDYQWRRQEVQEHLLEVINLLEMAESMDVHGLEECLETKAVIMP